MLDTFAQNVRGKPGLLFRVDHALGDGISMVALTLSFATDADGQKLQMPKFTRPSSSGARQPSLGEKLQSAAAMAKKVAPESVLRASATVLAMACPRPAAARTWQRPVAGNAQ